MNNNDFYMMLLTCLFTYLWVVTAKLWFIMIEIVSLVCVLFAITISQAISCYCKILCMGQIMIVLLTTGGSLLQMFYLDEITYQYYPGLFGSISFCVQIFIVFEDEKRRFEAEERPLLL